MRIDPLDLTAGAIVMVGRPAVPMISTEATAQLAAAVAKVPGVSEAHLPQVYAHGVSAAPAQVLVLVLEPRATADGVMAVLGPCLHEIIPKGLYLDVWPLAPGHSLLGAVRQAQCQVYGGHQRAEAAAQSPWWKFWT